MAKITVLETEISIIQVENEDYICLTDMLKAKDGDFFVTDGLRNQNTLEYIGIWEQINNRNFNYGEFARIRNKSGSNSFKILNLLLSVMAVSVETVDIVAGLPGVEWE